MAIRGENCNDWLRTAMTGGCLLVIFDPDRTTGNDDDDDDDVPWKPTKSSLLFL